MRFSMTRFAIASCLVAAASVRAAERPNIILIMSDDMGYSDLGCYGSEIATPTLDALAASGLRYTQFYNTARCCPTRASLMTGLYPHQAGVGHMMDDRGADGYRGDLNEHCVTIAQVLKSAGYAAYMTGKWHVTKATAPEGPKDNWPLQRGFDKFYGTITGASSYYDPHGLVNGNTMISAYADPEYQPQKYYYTNAISDHAVRYIRQHEDERPQDQPFFMYVAFTAAHWPMHALEEDIAKYNGRYDGGYAAIRKERLERMRTLGMIEPEWGLSEAEESWDNVENPEWEASNMEVYAAMIDRMDRGIGRIVQTLKDTGEFDNTLIFFLQDNGGCAETWKRKPRKDQVASYEPMPLDELQTSYPVQTRDGRAIREGTEAMPGADDTYSAYGKGWANVSNTPFRMFKHWTHEGGISTPLIVHWPNGFAARNEFRSEPAHLVDIMATCVDVAGATYPRELEGVAITPMEGRSLATTFSGGSLGNRALFWEHEGHCAIRMGKWKLVTRSDFALRGDATSVPMEEWELYDMEKDRSELNNLANKQPERVAEMAMLWEAYANRANVYPLPGRN